MAFCDIRITKNPAANAMKLGTPSSIGSRSHSNSNIVTVTIDKKIAPVAKDKSAVDIDLSTNAMS